MDKRILQFIGVHATFALSLAVSLTIEVMAQTPATTQVVDQATMDRAYAKLRQREALAATRPTASRSTAKVSGVDVDPFSKQKKLADAAAAEAVAARQRAIEKFRETDDGKTLIQDVSVAQKKQLEAEAHGSAQDKFDAGTALLNAKNTLASAEGKAIAADSAAADATAMATAAAGAYQQAVKAAAAEQQANASKIRDKVTKGMKVADVVSVLGKPESISSSDRDLTSYVWIVYTEVEEKFDPDKFHAVSVNSALTNFRGLGPPRKHKVVSREILAIAKDGVIVSATDTKLKIEDEKAK